MTYSKQPTKRAEWVKVGDRCIAPLSGWVGTVVGIRFGTAVTPTAQVLWDNNGHTGCVPIFSVRKYV